MSDTQYRGRAWVFGDDIANDGGLMPLEFVLNQEYDPDVLAKHVFARLMPTLAAQAKAQDVVFAGRNFGYGNPHVQGFLGLKGLGVGLVVDTMSRGPFRACVNAGVPVLTGVALQAFTVETGDEVEVDFDTGHIVNESRGTKTVVQPTSDLLRQIVRAGGGLAYTKQVLSKRTAQ